MWDCGVCGDWAGSPRELLCHVIEEHPELDGDARYQAVACAIRGSYGWQRGLPPRDRAALIRPDAQAGAYGPIERARPPRDVWAMERLSQSGEWEPAGEVSADEWRGRRWLVL